MAISCDYIVITELKELIISIPLTHKRLVPLHLDMLVNMVTKMKATLVAFIAVE